jgi:filamin
MLKCENLQTDLHDGVLLFNLLEVISSKSLGKYNKAPKIKFQKIENLNACLAFLKSEGIQLVGIGGEDIEEGNLKLILGLIWTIILRYQIQVSQAGSAKQELLDWVRSKIPEYNINNFTSDWQSGKAICALAEAVKPGQMRLPSDFSNNPIRDAQMGITKAKDNMNIPNILDAEDMAQNPDELSNMTYISYFRDYLDMQKRRKDQELFERTPVAEKCRAYGRGIEPGNEAGNETDFTIEAINGAGRRVPCGGHTFVTKITDPKGKQIPSHTKDNNDGTYLVAYTPEDEGNHIIEVTFQGKQIQKSPFQVYINSSKPDPSQTLCYGPGLESGEAHKPANFTIEARNKAGKPIKKGGHPYTVVVTNPYGEQVPAEIKDKNDGTYQVTYTPTDPGDFKVEVKLGSQHCANSPYTVPISENMNLACAAKSYADGPGIEPGNKNTDDCVFTIHAVTPDGKPKKKGGDAFDVQIEDPNKNLIPVDVKDNNDGTYTVKYKPTDPGNYHVEVLQRNPSNPLYFDHIKNSPVDVQIDPGTDAAHCIAYGPGLEPGNLDTHPATFTIEARDKNGNRRKEGGENFDVDIQGPNGPIKAKVDDNGDGTYNVTYQPEDAGMHDIAVTLGDAPIKGSTFHVDIAPGAWAANSSIENYTFMLQTRDKKNKNMTVGGAPVKVDIQAPNKQKVNVDLKDNNDGTYIAKYSIKGKGAHTVNVTIDGHHVQGSPFTQNMQ